jgi:hypothetical protein
MSIRPAARLLLAVGLTAGCGVAVAQAHGTKTGRTHAGSGSAQARHADVQAARPEPSAPTGTRAPRPAAAAVRDAARTSYAVPAGDVSREAKQLASDVALTLTTYGPSQSLDRLAGEVTGDPARQQALVRAAGPLYHRGATSSAAVVYPQLGGLTTDRASVMVVVRQQVHGGGSASDETRVLDVRLLRANGRWTFDALASTGGDPVARPADLSALATTVLADHRIWLPDSARWDIYAGRISPVLLDLMERVADRTPYAVTVLESGHPHDVFGTSHPSMHSYGRAMDINTVGSVHVAAQRSPGSPAQRLVQWLLAQPRVGQVGSPWDLDGAAGSRSFTNAVHLDHVHVSV